MTTEISIQKSVQNSERVSFNNYIIICVIDANVLSVGLSCLRSRINRFIISIEFGRTQSLLSGSINPVPRQSCTDT